MKCVFSNYFCIWPNKQREDVHHEWNNRLCSSRYMWLHRSGKKQKNVALKIKMILVGGVLDVF